MSDHAQQGEVGYTVYDPTTGEEIAQGFTKPAADHLSTLTGMAVCTDLDFRVLHMDD